MTKKDKAVLDTWETYTIDTDTDQQEDAAGGYSDIKTGELLISGLSEATVYQVKIGARNSFGWNYSEDIFVFGTKGAGEKKKIIFLFFFKIQFYIFRFHFQSSHDCWKHKGFYLTDFHDLNHFLEDVLNIDHHYGPS